MTPSAPPRRRFRFSLRTLFVLVTVFGVWFGWELKFVRERQAVREELQRNGGIVQTAAEIQQPWFVGTRTIPFWRRWLGDEAMWFVGPLYDLVDEPRIKYLERLVRLFPEADVSAPVLSEEEERVVGRR
jgi:hypothetical protein